MPRNNQPKRALNPVAYVFSRLGRLTSQFPRFPHAFSLVWNAARKWTIAWGLLLIARGLLPVGIVYLTRPLVNAALAAMRPGGPVAPAITDAILMASLLLADEALRTLQSWVKTAQSELVGNHISSLVQQKSALADLGFYETPDFFDHLHRARSEAANVPLALIENLGSLAQNTITLVAMAGLLTRFGVWLPFALVASTLPALYVVLFYAVRHHQWWVRSTSDERRSQYYDWVLTSRQHAAELRLFHLGPYFQSRFRDVRGKLAGEKIGLAREQSAAEFAAGVAALAISGLSLLWMASRAIRGQATAGDIALFYQAFQQGSGLTRTLLASVGQIYRNSLYLEGLFEFLELQPMVPVRPDPLPAPEKVLREIRFTGVSFRYPGSPRLALDNFDLEIPAGQITAIVGENGAGKSTLVKLLCRFYDPDAGQVEIDQTSLREFDPDRLRRYIAVLFQDPAHYNATVAENIGPGEEIAHLSADAVTEAARAAGADTIAAKLPLGYEHMLGRWFAEGAELSGGEWQRIALARAFMRAAPILVLDEPTSAMDPWAEADWLERFRRLAAGRTAVVITHRFTTARIAHRIAVMAGGRIIEQGTHEQLIALGGRYAVGWTSQRERTVV